MSINLFDLSITEMPEEKGVFGYSKLEPVKSAKPKSELKLKNMTFEQLLEYCNNIGLTQFNINSDVNDISKALADLELELFQDEDMLFYIDLSH